MAILLARHQHAAMHPSNRNTITCNAKYRTWPTYSNAPLQPAEYPNDLYLSDVESVTPATKPPTPSRATKPVVAPPIQSHYQQDMYIHDLVEVPQTSNIQQAAYQQEMYIDDLIEVPAKPAPAPEPTAVDILSYNVASWDASMAYTVSEQTWVPSFTPAQALDTNETFGFEDGPAGGYLKIDANRAPARNYRL